MKKRNLLPKDLKRLENLSGGEYHRERNLFIYASSCHARDPEIRVLNLNDNSEQTMVTGGSNPRISPDGSRFCYLSAGQIWIHDLATGKDRQLTTMRRGVSDPIWSPNGEALCFTSPCAADADSDWLQTLSETSEAERITLNQAPVIIEDFGYKFDGLGFHRPERRHLWVVRTSGGKAWRLTDGEYDHLLPCWAPDGSSIIFISSRCRDRKEALANDLFSVSAASPDESGSQDLSADNLMPEGHRITRLTSSGWFTVYPTPLRPRFTPDGKYIIAGMFEAEDMKRGGDIPFAILHRISADGSEIVKRFPDDAPCHECVQFPYNTGTIRGYETAQVSSDGKGFIFSTGVDGACTVFRAELYEEPKIRQITHAKQMVSGIDKPQGGVCAAAVGDAARPGEYWLIDEQTGKRVRKLAVSNEWLHEIALSQPEEFRFDCLDGSGRVHGWVLPPQNAEPGKKYPAVLYIHGGPHPFYSYGFDFEHQMLAGAGMAVLYCNPRGSSSYGREHENMTKAYDGSAYTDLLQFVDEACRRFDFIDSDRIGATGGSYGGYIVNYMAVHSNRFRAFVTQRSIANNQISYASSDMQGDSSRYPHFEEFMVNNIRESAVSYSENLKAPMLILHGEDDLRCPVEHAHQLFTAFRDVRPDIPVKMILYPGCAHHQPRDFNHLMHYYHAMLDWFTTHLQVETENGESANNKRGSDDEDS